MTRRQHPLFWAAALVLGGLFVVVAVLGTSMRTADTDDPEALVSRLSSSGSATPPDKAPEDALVALGKAALPALERALHLGLRGREAQAFIDGRASKRLAVVRVLDRIQEEGATDLLVRALADHPDNYAMRDANLRAVERRDLSREHLKALLGENPYPKPVILALRKLEGASADHALRPLVVRIHDPDVAERQLRNEHGRSNATPRDLWELRLLSGRVLGKDMLPEMRQRAASLVHELKSLGAQRDTSTLARSERERAQWGGGVTMALFALHALGKPVQESVREAAKGSSGGAGAVLDMARLIVGEDARLDSVTTTLADSPDASLRYVAMAVLARVKDPRSKPALWKALNDPLSRELKTCVPLPGRDNRDYPIRRLAARTLIDMGADEAEVRRRSPSTGGK